VESSGLFQLVKTFCRAPRNQPDHPLIFCRNATGNSPPSCLKSARGMHHRLAPLPTVSGRSN
jgi:hypothetical protein